MTIKKFFESEETYQQYLQAEEELKMEKSDELLFIQIIIDLLKSCLPKFLK